MRQVTKNGYTFNVDMSQAFSKEFWDAWENGSWEPETFNTFDGLISEGDTYIDVDAWIGPTVMYASRLASKCYAFEPDPVAYSKLDLNVAENCKNVLIYNEAISDYSGMLKLGGALLGDSGTSFNKTDNAFEVKCRTLASFVESMNISSPMFIKVDVEGAEEIIFRDIEFFEKYKPTIFVSLHEGLFKNPVEALETLRKVGRLYEYFNTEGATWLMTDL